MALQNERNTNLAFDTAVMRNCANQYSRIAQELRDLTSNLDASLQDLKKSGWTTPAGTAFHQMVTANWSENIDKYSDMLDTLKNILLQSAQQYDDLVSNSIERTKL